MKNKKMIKRLTYLFLSIVFLLPSGTIVNAFSENIEYEMDKEQKIIQSYIVYDENFIRFDMEKAIEDNVDEDIIAAGDIFNTLVSSEYEYYMNDGEVQTRRATVPIWGNWCGPEYGSGPPIDILDYGCREHDWCYRDRGYHKCSCDDDFLKYIINNKSRMTGGQKQATNAVEAWLRTKLNNPGKYGVLSCVW